MDRNFKVGDRVRIRSWESMFNDYCIDWEGDIPTPCKYFVHQMKNLCGIEATIKEIVNEDVILCNFNKYQDEALRWSYSIYMIEKVKEG